MIVVDSSVWIANLRNSDSAAVQKLRSLNNPREIIVGDIVPLEVLQGARDEGRAAIIERDLRQFEIQSMLGEKIASHAARNYRTLREQGVTIRKTAGQIIGTFCFEGGHELLHEDRDFDAMAERLGLAVL
jgi:predicted nucleic acid-binding protein